MTIRFRTVGGTWAVGGRCRAPWLEPGFREKDYGDLAECIRLALALIDRFNQMLQSIVAMPEFKHVRYVDLRGTLSTKPKDYKRWWGNELHPTRDGIAMVTKRFADEL